MAESALNLKYLLHNVGRGSARNVFIDHEQAVGSL
jgi:hypothetical protein